MIIVNIVAILILVFSFIGGFKEGAVKSFFSLITLIISLPIASKLFHFMANILSFLPGEDWQNFIGFFITLAIVSVIWHFIFFLPRKILQTIFGSGCIMRPIGGVITLFNSFKNDESAKTSFPDHSRLLAGRRSNPPIDLILHGLPQGVPSQRLVDYSKFLPRSAS